MKATLLPDAITQLTPSQVIRAFRSAYGTVCGKDPSRECLALLVAQSALETGRWRSIHRFNFGNVKASQDYTGYYVQFRCNEVINGKLQWFDPPHSQCNFRAFESDETGAIDHLRFLSQRKRYAHAWEVAQSGMPLAFVDALKRAGYFTADEQPYARAVASLWREYMALTDKVDHDTMPVPMDDGELCQGLLCLAPDPERWVDEELRVLAQRALELSDPLEAARQERREQMREE